MQTKIKAKKKSKQEQYNALVDAYRVRTPEQVKLHIIWVNLMQLVYGFYGKTVHNDLVIEKYNSDFKLAEQAERDGYINTTLR
jgi:hypothetical protein